MTYNSGNQLSDPAREIIVITPDDEDVINPPLKAIRADGEGVLRLVAKGGAGPVDHPVLAGERIDAIITAVHATGTSGQTDIIGYR